MFNSSRISVKRFILASASTVLIGASAAACTQDLASAAMTDSTSAAISAVSSATADSIAANSSSSNGGAASTSTADATSTEQTISATSKAAQEFLKTLDDTQRAQVLYAYDDESKSTTWSNFPVTFVDRAGLNLADLTDEQQQAALEVLKQLLNEEAYAKVEGIMAGDEYLHENSSSTEDSLGQYYIAFFGEPDANGNWALQFGGHHLGINATIADGEITFAPTHFGSQPVEYTNADGQTVSPLSGMLEDAFAFYNSLTSEQKSQLYQGEQVATMVCAPGSTCDYPTGTGLKGSDLTDEQKDLLIDVIANWVDLSDEETTNSELEAIRATLDDTYINWSGATAYDTSQGDGIYYQISGPKVYIELASQQGSAGADVDGVITAGWGHVHTIYRDPTNDYAGSVTQQEATSGPGSGGGPGMDGISGEQRRSGQPMGISSQDVPSVG